MSVVSLHECVEKLRKERNPTEPAQVVDLNAVMALRNFNHSLFSGSYSVVVSQGYKAI